MRKTLLFLLLLALTTFSFVSCKKQQWDQTFTSKVNCEASSNEVTLAGKPFIMDFIEFQLIDLTLTGERLQGSPISLSQSLGTQIDFLNPTVVPSFDIPQGTYTSMIMETSLISTDTPSLKIDGIYYLSNGNTRNVSIAMHVDYEYFMSIQDTDGSNTVLIDVDNPKELRLYLDTDILFSDVNPGLWNAAAVTSTNGNDNVVIDELHNTDLYDALNAQVGAALTIQFK